MLWGALQNPITFRGGRAIYDCVTTTIHTYIEVMQNTNNEILCNFETYIYKYIYIYYVYIFIPNHTHAKI